MCHHVLQYEQLAPSSQAFNAMFASSIEVLLQDTLRRPRPVADPAWKEREQEYFSDKIVNAAKPHRVSTVSPYMFRDLGPI